MKDSVSREMILDDALSSGTEPIGILYDGSRLAIGDAKLSEDANSKNPFLLVYVTEIKYDPTSGVMEVKKSDGSVKIIKGLMTQDAAAAMFKPSIGHKGERGLPGDDGKDGRDGRPGLPGCQGIRGDRGPTGLRGKRGHTGIQGDKGPVGDKGKRGDKGVRGFDGDEGVKGIKGKKGDRGPTGSHGEKGPQGYQGPVGETGDIGCIGDTGDIGEKGNRGDPGPPGIPGIPGNPGRKGKDATASSGLDGIPGAVKDIVGGKGITTSWEPDADGNMVNKKITADCNVPCFTTTTVTTPATKACSTTCGQTLNLSGVGVVKRTVCVPPNQTITVTLDYNMQQIPDKLDAYTMDGNHTLLASTNTYVSGVGKLVFTYDSSKYGEQFEIELTGVQAGTAASASVSCK